ncbi:Ribonuclease VapC [Bordetella tumbae]|uniref:type II toxin-antitoxin system VapC family toxin n=1 Tax=Bordetella tumbae TaxID=1649139 RepID=UPI0039EFDCE3
MILADTSIWIDFLGKPGNLVLEHLLDDGQVTTHPYIIGELALGSLSNRDVILSSLMALPQVKAATFEEALHLLHHAELYGLGIGYVDLHLLASTLMTDDVRLWTRDRRLQQACAKINVPTYSPH